MENLRRLKLYAFFPNIDKLIIVVIENDKQTLKLDSSIIYSGAISEFELDQIPSQFVFEKDFYLSENSAYTFDELKTLAQSSFVPEPGKINFLNYVQY